MKNLKNTISALTLMVVLGLGAVSANAGFMITDRNAPCQDNSFTKDLADTIGGITVAGMPMLDGIIIIGRDGLMISDKSSECQTPTAEKDGIIIIGRDGIIITD